MSSYARELVKRLRDGEKQKENPLEIIRFSPDILKLGLSNDQLFDYCRRSARLLFVEKHPDKSGSDEASAIALRYSDAFDELSKREVFDRAIAEFREMQSYVRAEERTLHVQLQNLFRSVKNLTAAVDEAKKKFTAERKLRQGLERALVSNILRVKPGGGVVGIGECSKITVVTFGIVFAPGPAHMEKLPEACAAYEELRRMQRADDAERKAGGQPRVGRWGSVLQSDEAMNFLKIVNTNRLTSMPVSFFIEQVEQSCSKLPAVRWSYGRALQYLGFPEAINFESNEYGSIVQEGRGICGMKEAGRYRSIVRKLLDYFRDQHIFEIAIVPGKLSVQHQMFYGDALGSAQYHILGTAELYAGLSWIQGNAQGVLRKKVSRSVLGDTVPVLAPGRVLVTAEAPDPIKAKRVDALLFKKIYQLHEREYNTFVAHIVICAK